MRLKTKFLLFVGILHLLSLVLSFYIFRQNQVFFIVSEIFILISLLLSWRLYNEMILPLNTLVQGIDAIKDKDFNVKFSITGKVEMDELINVFNHMMDELRTERTRQQQQHFFLEKMIETSPTGILILDYDENIYQLNPKAEMLMGIKKETVLQQPIRQLTHPMMQQISRLASGEARSFSPNGIDTYKLQKSHFVDRGFPRFFIMMEELTVEILAAEKKAYGKVIRIMAHEVNNTLGPVNSIIESTLQTPNIWDTNANSSLREALQVALTRNNSLNLFMRNFADVVRLPDPSRRNFDLNILVRDVVKLMRSKANENAVDWDLDLCFGEFMVFADQEQMEQVLINIVKNALEAIELRGTIQFTTSSNARQLTIADNGKGIPEEMATDIFSPFFSTKKDGQGIGLTLVREILLNHQFVFSLHTLAAGNTQFTICF